ncbi:UNVERIFIED_CONTAM: hypothetical protein GTU68_025484 [Idotea baltica]|nr:hypothetical protein [Idotea baltica]
MPRMYSTIFL